MYKLVLCCRAFEYYHAPLVSDLVKHFTAPKSTKISKGTSIKPDQSAENWANVDGVVRPLLYGTSITPPER